MYIVLFHNRMFLYSLNSISSIAYMLCSNSFSNTRLCWGKYAKLVRCMPKLERQLLDQSEKRLRVDRCAPAAVDGGVWASPS